MQDFIKDFNAIQQKHNKTYDNELKQEPQNSIMNKINNRFNKITNLWKINPVVQILTKNNKETQEWFDNKLIKVSKKYKYQKNDKIDNILSEVKKKHTKCVRIASYQQSKRLEQTRQQRCDRIKYVRELYSNRQRLCINKRPNNIAKVKQKNNNLVIK